MSANRLRTDNSLAAPLKSQECPPYVRSRFRKQHGLNTPIIKTRYWKCNHGECDWRGKMSLSYGHFDEERDDETCPCCGWVSLEPDFTQIFISRKRCAARHILNEDELQEALPDFQFVAVEDYQDCQARLFHVARVIVGAHGSAFANVVFCEPGARIIEIRDTGEEKGWVAKLAEARGCDYRAIPLPDFRDDMPITRVNPDKIRDAISK